MGSLIEKVFCSRLVQVSAGIRTLVLLLMMCPNQAAFNAADDCANWSITTVVGGGTGDGGPAFIAAVDSPFGLWLANSSLFVADSAHGYIRRVDPNGTISTIAGVGLPPVHAYYSVSNMEDEGGPATSASLVFPAGIVTDAAATTLWVAEVGSHRVRVINLVTGVINTAVGNGTATFFGDGGAASLACVLSPFALAIHPLTGTLTISDTGNNRIRSIANGVIATIVGTGEAASAGDGLPGTLAAVNAPGGLSWDAEGTRLFFADWDGNRVRMWNASNGVVAALAGTGCLSYFGGAIFDSGDGGPALSACFSFPTAVLSVGETLFITEQNFIRAINMTSGVISTIAGGGGSQPGVPSLRNHHWEELNGTSSQFSTVTAPVFDFNSSSLLVCDVFAGRVRRLSISTDGTVPLVSTVIGSRMVGLDPLPAGSIGLGGPGTAAMLASPDDVLVYNDDGSLVIADATLNRVLFYNGSTGTMSLLAGNGIPGAFSGDGGPARDAGMFYPRAVASDGSGGVFIAEGFGNRIRHVNVSGFIVTVAGTGAGFSILPGEPAAAAGIGEQIGVSFDPASATMVFTYHGVPSQDGCVLYARGDNSSGAWIFGPVSVIAGTGSSLTAESGDGRAALAALNAPGLVSLGRGVGASKEFNLVLCTSDSLRIMPAPTGNITVDTASLLSFLLYDVTKTFLSPVSTGQPLTGGGGVSGAVIDGSGNVFASATFLLLLPGALSQVRSLSVIAGNGQVYSGSYKPDAIKLGSSGYCGDGGSAYFACLDPGAITVTSNGSTLWVTDAVNRRIRKIWCSAVMLSVEPTSIPSSITPLPSPASIINDTTNKTNATASAIIIICASGRYVDTSGLCTECPPSASVWDMLRPMLILCGVLAIVVVTACTLVLSVAWLCGGTVEGGIARFLEFASWLITGVQIMGQVGQAASAGAPAFLASVFSVASAFQLVGVTLPSACLTWLRPFSMEITLFVLVLALECAALLVVRQQYRRVFHWASKDQSNWGLFQIFAALGLLYPRVASAAVSLVNCTSVSESAQVIASLDGGAVIAGSAARDSQVSTLVLVGQPSFLCYAGSHLAAGVLAWILLVVMVVGYPVITLVWVYVAEPQLAASNSSCCWLHPRMRCTRLHGHHTAQSTRMLPVNAASAAFIGATYEPSAFYLIHLDWGLLLALCLLSVLWQSPATVSAVASKSTLACTALAFAGMCLVLHPAPYPPHARWRLPLRVYVLVLSMFAAICNGVHDAAMLGQAQGTVDSTITTLALAIVVTAGAVVFAVLVVAVLFITAIRGAHIEESHSRAIFIVSNTTSAPKAVHKLPTASSQAALGSSERLWLLAVALYSVCSRPWPILRVQEKGTQSGATGANLGTAVSGSGSDRIYIATLPRARHEGSNTTSQSNRGNRRLPVQPRRPRDPTFASQQCFDDDGGNYDRRGGNRLLGLERERLGVAAYRAAPITSATPEFSLLAERVRAGRKTLDLAAAATFGAADSSAWRSQQGRLRVLRGSWQHAPVLNPLLQEGASSAAAGGSEALRTTRASQLFFRAAAPVTLSAADVGAAAATASAAVGPHSASRQRPSAVARVHTPLPTRTHHNAAR